MATDPRKRQKKLAKLAAKRKEKREDLVKEYNAGIAEQLRAAARYPILHCWVMSDLWNQGMGHVSISREMPGNRVAVGTFLIDRWCLGVKNAFGKIMGRYSYDNKYRRELLDRFELEELPPSAARKLIEGAVAYAQQLGFAPHPDYHKAKMIFGDIDPSESLQEFEYGDKGKPHFFAGPNDGPARCKAILARLVHSCGVGNFHYTFPAFGGDLSEMIPEELRYEKARLIGPDVTGAITEWPANLDNEKS